MFRGKLVFLQRGLTQAAELIRSVQQRQALIGSLEELAYLLGFIATGDFQSQATKYHSSPHGLYLKPLTEEPIMAQRSGYF